MNKRFFLAAAAALLLAGCAHSPIPEGYTGPVATVADSGFAESGSKAQLFVLAAIDGRQIPDSFGATASASHGQGFTVRPKLIDREVPARPMKVLLQGSHTTGAPIHALFSQATGNFFSVEGTVDFTPEAGRQYVVKGNLGKESSSVWIEDAQTREPVTAKVMKP